jgi:HAD superfamily hydrolase (TIGR01509 family)
MDDVAAVLFDLDGTLAVHDQPFEGLWERALSAAGVDDVAPEHVAAVDLGALPTAETRDGFLRTLAEAAGREAGVALDDGTAAAAADAYVEAHDPTAVSFRAGAEAALSAARQRYPVGLVTNGDRATQTAKLEALGVADAFDAAVFCDPAAGVHPKPDPTPLEMAADGVGVAPSATVLVGNDLRADVGAARNAGARSAWVPKDEPPGDPAPAPDHVLAGMDEVAALLDG